MVKILNYQIGGLFITDFYEVYTNSLFITWTAFWFSY